MALHALDSRQSINRSALSVSIGSSAGASLDVIFGLIDTKMVTLTGTQTLTNKTINGANNSLTVRLGSDVTGVLPIANGGTDNGSLAVTAGGVIYTDGTKLQNAGPGTGGQVLTSTGAGAPIWSAGGGTAPIGGIQDALLNETQFQAQMGTGWILGDGRSVSGSTYESIVLGSSVTMSVNSSTTTTSTVTFSTISSTETGNTHSNNQINNLGSGFGSFGLTPGMIVFAQGVPTGTTLLSLDTVTFTTSSANATIGAIYSTNSGAHVAVQTTIVAGTTLITAPTGGTFTGVTSGTLTLVSGTGDATITYSAYVGSVTISASSTSTLTATQVWFGVPAVVVSNAHLTSGSAVVTNIGNTSGISPAMAVSAPGSGIPNNTGLPVVNTVTPTAVPDLRGMVLRGANNGGSSAGTRADGNQDPAGNFAPGTYEADQFASHNHGGGTGGQSADHTHSISTQNSVGGSFPITSGGTGTINIFQNTNGTSNDHTHAIGAQGSAETRVKAVIVNHFIRIN